MKTGIATHSAENSRVDVTTKSDSINGVRRQKGRRKKILKLIWVERYSVDVCVCKKKDTSYVNNLLTKSYCNHCILHRPFLLCSQHIQTYRSSSKIPGQINVRRHTNTHTHTRVEMENDFYSNDNNRRKKKLSNICMLLKRHTPRVLHVIRLGRTWRVETDSNNEDVRNNRNYRFFSLTNNANHILYTWKMLKSIASNGYWECIFVCCIDSANKTAQSKRQLRR